MARIILVGVMIALLSGCSSRVDDLKSPCAGTEGSPCDRRPVNDWWV